MLPLITLKISRAVNKSLVESYNEFILPGVNLVPAFVRAPCERSRRAQLFPNSSVKGFANAHLQ